MYASVSRCYLVAYCLQKSCCECSFIFAVAHSANSTDIGIAKFIVLESGP